MPIRSVRSDVSVYSTPTCPDCKALKSWLRDNGISFVERDLSKPAIAEVAKARSDVRVAPIMIIGEEILYGTFLAQRPRLGTLFGLQHRPAQQALEAATATV